MTWLLAQTASTAQTGENDTYLLFGFLLLGIALVLLFLELFIPSGGLIGLVAGVAAIGSIICFFKYETVAGAVATGAYLVLGPIVGFFAFKYWLNSPLAKNMILGADEHDSEGWEQDSAMSTEHVRLERLAQLRQLIGAQGVALTSLRPVGTVKISGQRIDAMAESGVIDAGTPIIVTDVYDNQIKVRGV
jgi:membrane-bound ClpP family serine protease